MLFARLLALFALAYRFVLRDEAVVSHLVLLQDLDMVYVRVHFI